MDLGEIQALPNASRRPMATASAEPHNFAERRIVHCVWQPGAANAVNRVGVQSRYPSGR